MLPRIFAGKKADYDVIKTHGVGVTLVCAFMQPARQSRFAKATGNQDCFLRSIHRFMRASNLSSGMAPAPSNSSWKAESVTATSLTHYRIAAKRGEGIKTDV